MSQNVSIELRGQREIEKLLKDLPKEAVKKKVLSKALRAGARPIIKSARSKIKEFDFEKTGGKYTTPVNSKVLKKSIGTVIRKGKRFNDYYAVVGPQVGGANDGWFAHWIEYGTLFFRTEPLVKGRRDKAVALVKKRMGFRKNPFLRPALFQQGLKAKSIILKIVLAEIKKFWDKENK